MSGRPEYDSVAWHQLEQAHYLGGDGVTRKPHGSAPSYGQVRRNAEAVNARNEKRDARRRATPAIGRQGSNVLGLHPCVGYFDRPGEQPIYDPGWGVTPCLICGKPLGGVKGPNEGGNIRTIGLLGHDGNADLSLFYRVHITCAEADPDSMTVIDGSVMHGQRGAYAADLAPEAIFAESQS